MTDASTFFPGQLYQNPDGSFSLDITGHVHAAGLDLDAGINSTPPDTDRIRWLRTSDGAVIADQVTFSQGGLELFAIQAHTPTPTDTSQMQLIAADDANGIRAQLTIAQTNRGAAASVSAMAGGLTKTILRQDGASAYLQLAAGTALQGITYGTNTCTWPGGAGNFTSSATPINHGLGRIPAIVLVTAIGGMTDGQGQAAIFATNDNAAWTNTQFTVSGKIGGQYYTPALNVQAKFGWIAIG